MRLPELIPGPTFNRCHQSWSFHRYHRLLEFLADDLFGDFRHRGEIGDHRSIMFRVVGSQEKG